MQTMPGRHGHGQKGSLAERGWPWRSRQQEASIVHAPCSWVAVPPCWRSGWSTSMPSTPALCASENLCDRWRRATAAAGGAAFLTPWRASAGQTSVKMPGELPANHCFHLRVMGCLWPCKNFQELYRRAFSFRLFMNSLYAKITCASWLFRTLNIFFPVEIVIIRLTSKPTKYHNISEV